MNNRLFTTIALCFILFSIIALPIYIKWRNRPPDAYAKSLECLSRLEFEESYQWINRANISGRNGALLKSVISLSQVISIDRLILLYDHLLFVSAKVDLTPLIEELQRLEEQEHLWIFRLNGHALDLTVYLMAEEAGVPMGDAREGFRIHKTTRLSDLENAISIGRLMKQGVQPSREEIRLLKKYCDEVAFEAVLRMLFYGREDESSWCSLTGPIDISKAVQWESILPYIASWLFYVAEQDKESRDSFEQGLRIRSKQCADACLRSAMDYVAFLLPDSTIEQRESIVFGRANKWMDISPRELLSVWP